MLEILRLHALRHSAQDDTLGLALERWTFAFAQVQVSGLALEHWPPATREAKYWAD